MIFLTNPFPSYVELLFEKETIFIIYDYGTENQSTCKIRIVDVRVVYIRKTSQATKSTWLQPIAAQYSVLIFVGHLTIVPDKHDKPLCKYQSAYL